MSEEELELLLAMDLQIWEAYLPYLATIIQQEVAVGSFLGLTQEEIIGSILDQGLTEGQLQTYITTALNDFSRSVTFQQMFNNPANTKYIYIGPLDGKTRDICLRMGREGKLTRREIIRTYGRSVLRRGGGWNCRHAWEEHDEEFGVTELLHNPQLAGELLSGD